MPVRRRFSAAVLVVVSALAGVVLAGCDSPPVVLSGVVSTAAGPTPNFDVDVYDTTGNSLIARTHTDSTGSYSFSTADLSDGTYLVAFGESGSAGWWEHASDAAHATPVAVASAAPATVSPVLSAGSVTGTVSDSSGTGLAGATVEAVEASDWPAGRPIATVATTASGDYHVTGLPAGSYHVRVKADGWATRYVSDTVTGAISAQDAQTIVVAEGATSQVNALRLTAESTITGTVELGGQPLEGTLAVAYDSYGAVSGAAVTGSDGAFAIHGLSNAPYQVEAVDLTGHAPIFVWGTVFQEFSSGRAVTPPIAGSADLGHIHLGEDCQPGYADADLSGARFPDADFRVNHGGSYSGCDLAGTNLSGADLTGADLSGAALSGADLTGATLANANLDRVVSGKLTGTPAALPPGWRITGGFLVGPSANLSGASLLKVDLTGADLSHADLTGAHLFAVNLTGVNLAHATLDGVASTGLTGTPAALPPGWRITGGFLVGPTANLSGADLSGVDLSGVDLSHADLSSAKLIGANISGTNLSDATLTRVTTSGDTSGTPAALPPHWQLIDGALIGPGAFLYQADLDGVDLSGCDLSGASWYKVSLRGANLASCDLEGLVTSASSLRNATLTGADIEGAGLNGVDLVGVTSGQLVGAAKWLPPLWLMANGYLIGNGANLAGADLSGADLADANFANVTSGGITGVPDSMPTGYSIVNGYVVGPWVDLTGANLTGADLSGLDLTGAQLDDAILTGTNLEGTNFRNATGTGIVSGGITGTPNGLPLRYSLTKGYLVGPGAPLVGVDLSGADLAYAYLQGLDLTNVDLSNANLAHADLSGTNLSGTRLAGADLTGVTSGGITGTPAALPSGWALQGGTLVQTAP